MPRKKLIPLTQKTIDQIFEKATDQEEYIVALFKVAFPNWEAIKKINGFPKVSKKTSLYIAEKAMSFDREHHPDTFNGGLWMNYGFSSLDNENVSDWTIDINGVKVDL